MGRQLYHHYWRVKDILSPASPYAGDGRGSVSLSQPHGQWKPQICICDPTRHQSSLINLTIFKLPFLPFCQGIPESQRLPAKGSKTKESEAWPEKDKSMPFPLGRCWDEKALPGEHSPFAQCDSTESLTLQTHGSLLPALD